MMARAAFAREKTGAIDVLMDELEAVGECATRHRLEMARLTSAEISVGSRRWKSPSGAWPRLSQS